MSATRIDACNGCRALTALALAAICATPAAAQATARQPEAGEPLQEIWVAISAAGAARDALITEVGRELARTPQRHRLRFVGEADLGEPADRAVLAVFELVLDPSLATARIELARAEGVATPGWLLHAVLQAAEVVGLELGVSDRRSSWIGQLVARSTRRAVPAAADAALASGYPSALLRLPVGRDGGTGAQGISAPARLLSALSRRLDGLDTAPLFEDEFLVAGGRVWLRRDLYWSVLLLWLVLYWRGRRRPGREFRWAFLVAALVTPAFALVLAGLPAAVAAWRPKRLLLYWVALSPVALYGLKFLLAIAGDRRPVADLVPALVVTAALAIFVWCYLPRGDYLERRHSDTGADPNG